MRNLLTSLVIALLFHQPFGVSQQKVEKSLYHRIGGYDAIAAVVDDLLARVGNDPQLAPFFKGHSADSLKRDRQLIVEFICEGTGGPCFYTGRDMKTAHQGLGISEQDWQGVVKHLSAALEKFKVPAKEQKEFIAIIATFKQDVVTAK